MAANAFNLDAFNGGNNQNQFGYSSLGSYGAGSGSDQGLGMYNGYNPMTGLNNIDNSISGMKADGSWGNTDGAGSLGSTLGANIPTFQLGLAGIGALGNLWGAYQSNKLASNQFDYTKQITNTNLANQIQSYNTSLSDRASARGSMEGWSDAQTQDYVNKNKLSK